jgi:hypothetical protein
VTKTKLSSSNEYKTPAKTFRPLDARYHFNRDVAAAPWNAQCDRFFTKRDNALAQPWFGRCWMNCPYTRGNVPKWMGYARNEVLRGRAELVGCLVPGHTAEAWWDLVDQASTAKGWENSEFHNHGLGSTTILMDADLTVEITRLRGRRSFLSRQGRLTSARFPSVFIAYVRPDVQLATPGVVWGPGVWTAGASERRAA